MVPLLRGGVRHTGRVLTVLVDDSESWGTAEHSQLGAISRDPSDGIYKWQDTDGLYVADDGSNN